MLKDPVFLVGFCSIDTDRRNGTFSQKLVKQSNVQAHVGQGQTNGLEAFVCKLPVHTHVTVIVCKRKKLIHRDLNRFNVM